MLEKDKAILLSTWRHYVEKTANTGKHVMGFGEWMEEVYFVVTPTLASTPQERNSLRSYYRNRNLKFKLGIA